MASPSPQDIAAGVPAAANIVSRIAAPGGGEYLMGADGAIFATGGAKYAGGVNALQGDTLAGQHQFGANSLTAGPNGGYIETDQAGHQYAFGTPAPNPLAQDPAHLAFMRTSGLSYDQAVRDYENAVGLNQRHNAAALADLSDPFGQRALGREQDLQSYVNRGYAGSGVAAKGMTGYDTETTNQKNQINTDLADQNTAAGNTFSQTVGGLSTAGTEEGIKTGTSQGWNQFLNDEATKYPGQATAILGTGSSGGGA